MGDNDMKISIKKQYILVILLSGFSFIVAQDPVEHKSITVPEAISREESKGKLAFIAQEQEYKYDNQKTFSENITNAAEQSFTRGITHGIRDVTKSTISKVLNKFPEAVYGFGIRFGGYLYKLSHGSHGLSWNKLAIFNSRLTTLVLPLTAKSYINNGKDARANMISQNADPEFVDENWQSYQKLIAKEIVHIISELRRALPCYSPILVGERNFVQRGFARMSHALSLKDNEQISCAIMSTIYELEVLYDHIVACKTFKDVEQRMDHIKRWLVLNNHSFVQIGNLLKGSMALVERGELPMRLLDQRGGGAAVQNQMNDLFGGNSAMHLDSLLK